MKKLDSKWATALRVFLILLVGLVFWGLLKFFKDTPERVEPVKKVLPVELITARKSDKPVLLSAFGVVEAARKLEIRPQVVGHVIKVNSSFEIGGLIKKGEMLFEIDPRDYEVAVASAEAQYARNQFELEQEKGNQIVAKREWELIGKDLQSKNGLSTDLALRVPQLKEKKAMLSAAKGQLAKAELDLERTRLVAPFDLMVLEEMVEVGQYVSPQSIAAQVVGVDKFYVQAKLPRSSLEWLPVDNKTQVRVFRKSPSPKRSYRDAKIVRKIGQVDSAGRMAQLLISVSKPLESKGESEPLLLGSYVELEIEGEKIEGLYELPRGAIREDSRVWIMNSESQLDFRSVTTIYSKGDSSYVQGELKEGDNVVVSPLKNALKGTLLRDVSLDV